MGLGLSATAMVARRIGEKNEEAAAVMARRPDARLLLILGMRQVVRNGLGLLGVSAPEAM